MDNLQLSAYIAQAEQLIAMLDTQQEARGSLLQLIDRCAQMAAHNSPYEAFFKGERALFHGEYEHALRFYLQAKGIPHFEFFCYRASALISQAHGKEEKALHFAKKALKSHPNDPLCLNVAASSTEKHAAPLPLSQLFSSEKEPCPLGEQEMEELAKIFEAEGPSAEELFGKEVPPEQPSLAPGGPQQHESSAALDRRINIFHSKQSALIKRYLSSFERRPLSKDHLLHVIGGGNVYLPFNTGSKPSSSSELSQLFSDILPKGGKEGLFIRWNGKGIAINPSRHFLTYLHEQQLHLRDIDVVIVTHEAADTFASVKEIYTLNYQLNQVADELQIIHYYFNERSYQQLAPQLKPHFKQERCALHCLELFVDSPDVEKIDLGNEILLHYFPTTLHEAFKERRPGDHASLGICLELNASQQGLANRSIRLGYIGATAWSPLLAHLLGPCNILVAAFGHTSARDYEKINYNDDSLGYFGTFSLLEELHPRIALCSEFDGREGDIRIEVVKQLREDIMSIPTAVLPADHGLLLNLITMEIICSVSQEGVAAEHVRVAKPSRPFGQIRYLSPACCI